MNKDLNKDNDKYNKLGLPKEILEIGNKYGLTDDDKVVDIDDLTIDEVLIDTYTLFEEVIALSRKNYGLQTTNSNLNRKLESYYGTI